MLGEIAWMNAITNEFFGGCKIQQHPQNGTPSLNEITVEESDVVLKLPQEKEPVVIVKLSELAMQPLQAVQQTLF